MSNYLKYLMEADKEYNYRVKSIEPINDEFMEKLERLMKKYELRDISVPQKTIIQKHPLDFVDVSNAEVWYVDVKTGVPVSAYILQQEIRANFKIPEKFIVVRSDNDPLEIETAKINANREMEEEAEEKGLDRKPMLSTNSDYDEAEFGEDGENFFGNEYNKNFLDTLAQVSAERDNGYAEPAVDTLFNWLANDVEEVGDEMDYGDFNDNIDSVKPVPWWKATKKENKVSDELKSPEGSYDEDNAKTKRTYVDDTGKETKMEKGGSQIR